MSCEEDTINTLVYTIALCFVGTTELLEDRRKEFLMSLTCPTLSHFKRYGDAFISKVYMRLDSSSDFWKEKFISGLPPLFAEKVRFRII